MKSKRRWGREETGKRNDKGTKKKVPRERSGGTKTVENTGNEKEKIKGGFLGKNFIGLNCEEKK